MQQTYTPTQQNQQNYQNQQRMSKPPAYLTTKDLAYLKDAMSWELLAMKKCKHFAQECQDSEIENAINRAGRMHANHYRLLLKHINPSKSITG
ncbi:MAG: hypothetical protein ACLFPF_06500 [Halanaerobiales bacterium]